MPVITQPMQSGHQRRADTLDNLQEADPDAGNLVGDLP